MTKIKTNNQTATLNPSDILFTHSVISERFTGCGKLLRETLQEIMNNKTSINDIPKIKVFYITNGKNIIYMSENNRRLWVFKELHRNGIIDTINVRLEKATHKKYFNNSNSYSLNAKLK
jgi:hypothetical protein